MVMYIHTSIYFMLFKHIIQFHRDAIGTAAEPNLARVLGFITDISKSPWDFGWVKTHHDEFMLFL